MKLQPLLLAAALATGSLTMAQTPPTEPALAPAAGALITPSSPRLPAAPGAPLPATGWTAQQAAEVFLRVDTNRDGSLSRAEAQSITNARLNFEELDANKDGALSRSEFEAGVR
ncbi:MAG: EF-hand domain-containing protein [Pseudomonadota bacterium]